MRKQTNKKWMKKGDFDGVISNNMMFEEGMEKIYKNERQLLKG